MTKEEIAKVVGVGDYTIYRVIKMIVLFLYVRYI